MKAAMHLCCLDDAPPPYGSVGPHNSEVYSIMDFAPNEMQVALHNTMSRFVAERYAGEKRAHYLSRPEGYDPRGWSLLAELGLVSLILSEGSGGLGGAADDFMTALNALGPGLLLEPWLPALLSARLIDTLGSEEQKERWLPALASGESLMSFGHAEEWTGSDIHHCSTSARATEGGSFVLNGCKSQVLGPAGNAILLSARMVGEVGSAEGISLFIIPATAEGIESRPYRLADGSYAQSIRLVDCVVPENDRMGAPCAAAEALEDTIAFGCFLLASEAIGIMDAMIAATVDHLQTRKQFGTPLASFQAIQHRMADCAADLELARSLVLKAAVVNADASTSRQDRLIASFGAKALAGSVAFRLAEECVQFHGAIGLTEELWVARAAKRLWLIAGLFGDERVQTRRCDQVRSTRDHL